ncbi:hypothetical protein FE257_002233 [Aspergillus nanangensis]|uniref:histidine kinase n=1 Tax=Aspergillus nanangensis TaxID=2582783 RepID=A0AAD4CCX3_ASPNN|nr:hypothetical protein FE257_002233 [Aspergillus nanangensis]
MPDSVEPEWPNAFVTGHPRSFLPCKSDCLSGGSSAQNDNDDLQAGPHIRQSSHSSQHTVIERLGKLKQDIRTLDPEAFWEQLMENLTSICEAQYAFVARRVQDDELDNELGGHKACLYGYAFYYNDGRGAVGMHRHRYFAGGNPLLHMDKELPCLIPENLESFICFDRDKLPFAAAGYLTIPLFSRTKCIAHLGLMWSESGLQKRNLPWPFVEMVLHSLEDLVVQRVHNDTDPANANPTYRENNQVFERENTDDDQINIVQSHDDFTSQPLKPYARSLSHELRTPMHGIVGMLDVMHATVREAIQDRPSPKTGFVFQSLKESIEMVQDSARRAVEAADNVVHAYDLNMQVPQTPQVECDDYMGGPVQSPIVNSDSRPNIFIEGNNIAVNPYKRRRSNPAECILGMLPKSKAPRISSPKELSPRSEEVKIAVHESEKIIQATPAHELEAAMATMVDPRPSLAVRRSAPHLLLEGINFNLKTPALRFTKLRDLLRLVINESLHVGGRPDFAVTTATELGEQIEVRTRSSNGEIFSKNIYWSVDSELPATLFVDDRDLAKLISCVFLNAVKFTNNGVITVRASAGRKLTDVRITVQDTGPGIPDAFLPSLFKPFARQDASTTRSKDGLGLGLLVAKGLARKMGGDLICVRSSTSGPDRGSEFEIRIPANQPEPYAKPTAPASKLLTPPQLSDPTRSRSASLDTLRSPSIPLPPQPVQQPSPSLTDDPPSQNTTPPRSFPKTSGGSVNGNPHDKKLGEIYPLTFLVAEDNKINRRVLVNMLKRLGYHDIYEACNGKEAVRLTRNVLKSQRSEDVVTHSQISDMAHSGEFLVPESPNRRKRLKPVDVVLMDLWMPEMDGYEATSKILQLIDEYHGKTSPTHQLNSDPEKQCKGVPIPTVLAVSADVTDEALGRATKVGMKGYMTKPYKLTDLERLILGFCSDRANKKQ